MRCRPSHALVGCLRTVKEPKGLFEDAEFPATNASIGGVTGDSANPLAPYLKQMLKYVVPGWARPRQASE